MAADPTGMKGAQQRDGRVEQAGRARRAGRAIANVGRGVWSRVPGTDARARRLAGINADANRAVNQQLLEGMVEMNKPAEEREQFGGATKGGETSDMLGDKISDFAKIFRETLRRGRSMDAESDVQDSLLRQVLCHQTVIDIVKDDTIAPTPIEREQPGCFAEQRAALAQMLERRVIGNLDAEQLDILFVTMVGKQAVEVADASGRSKYVAFWSRWPQDSGLPTPDQAFFQYLESVASKQANTAGGTSEGRYIGEVLKSMGEARTIGDSPGGVRSIIDHGYVDTYLESKAAAATDRTVSAFEKVLDSVMSTPANQIHAETGVPGLGFTKVDEGEIEQKQQEALSAKERVDQLTAELRDAAGKKEAAVNTLAQVRQMVEQLKSQNAGPDQLQQAEETLELAEIEKEQADAEFDAVHARRERAHLGLKQLVEGYNVLATEAMERERRLVSLVDTFRDTLLEQRDATELDQLPSRMEWAQNPEVKKLLEEMDEVLGDRELLIAAIIEEHARAVAQKNKDDPAPEVLEVAENKLSREMGEQKEKVDELKEKIERANLPEEVKADMRKIVASIEDLSIPRSMVDPKKEKVRKRYGYPLVEVTKEALKKLEEDESLRIGEISDREWVIARTIWERSGDEMASRQIKKRGFFDRLGDGIVRWGTTTYGIRKVLRFAFKWTTLTALHKNLISKHRREPIPNRKENGEIDEQNPTVKAFGLFTLRQFHKGLLHLTFLAYAITTLVIGIKYSPSLSDHYWRGPIESRGWLVPAERQKTYRRVIGDSYDLPNRLAERGEDYYRDAFGVSKSENLQWIAKNTDVLRFFQERRSLRRVKSYEENLADTPETCSTKQSPIPVSCKRLGLESEDDIVNYTGGPAQEHDDGWRPGKNMPVCCTFSIEYEELTDGLKLNRAKADEFVSYLRTQATGKATIDMDYLTKTENMLTWTERRFLISKQQDAAMDRYGISEVENIEFAVAQSAHLDRKLRPLVVVGDSERFLLEKHRDGFLTAWRDAIVAKNAEVDPRLDTIADGLMDETFDSVLAANKGWTRDTTTEYRQKQLSKEITQLNIRTETSRDIYIAQEDIRTLLQKMLASEARYVVNPGRSDELVRFLDRQKRSGTEIVEFDPFAEPPGRRAQALINAGLIGQRENFVGAEQRRDSSDTKVRNALSEDAQSFYADESHKNFNMFLDARIDALFSDDNLGEAMRQAYGGDRDATKRAIKADVHRLLTSTKRRDVQLRDSYGINVTMENEQIKTITFDARRARRGLTNRISTFIRTHGRDTQ